MSYDKVNSLLWKVPTHLNPDDIQHMERGSPNKNAKCVAMTKPIIFNRAGRGIFGSEKGPNVLRPAAMSVICFGVVPKLNLQISKPLVQDCVSWIVANVPAQFRKGISEFHEKLKVPT